jgi:hypothetical protein
MNLLILFTPRSGSTLLADDLSVNGIGNIFEMFYRKDRIFRKEDVSVLDHDRPWSEYPQLFEAYRINGIFGVKLNYNSAVAVDTDFGKKGQPGSGLLEMFGSDCRVLIINRDDIISQAASLYVASTTGKWGEESITSEDLEKVIVDRQKLWYRLLIRVNEISRENFLFRLLIKGAGFRNVMTVSFEDYVSRRIEYIARIARWLELKPLEAVQLSARQQYAKVFLGPILRDFRTALLTGDYNKYLETSEAPASFLKAAAEDRAEILSCTNAN